MVKKSNLLITTIILALLLVPTVHAWSLQGWLNNFFGVTKRTPTSNGGVTSPTTNTAPTNTCQEQYFTLQDKYNSLTNSYNLLQQQKNALFNQNTDCNNKYYYCHDQLTEAQRYAQNIKDVPRTHDYSYTITQSGTQFIITFNTQKTLSVLSPTGSRWHWNNACTKSMNPMLDCDDSVIIEEKPIDLEMFDIVGIPMQTDGGCGGTPVYTGYPPSNYCVHQIISITGDYVVTQGTANYQPDNPTKKSDILFKVIR